MGLLTKHYEIIKDAPKEIAWNEYYPLVMEEYLQLLKTSGDDEKAFQVFFENNPSFIPGALELFGQSGHYPHMDTLISQPQLGVSFKRIPDYVWLAQDSLTFCPVFVEIEKPNKKMFNLQGNASADFTQAIGQIKEWRGLLKNPINVQVFYEYFDIPLHLRKKVFNPQFLLIYGRREEYENNEMLTLMRSELQENNIEIMSFDRLKPLADYQQFTCSKVKHKQYHIISIPPTFRYRADCAEVLYLYQGFKEKIDEMKHTSDGRKEFLKNRYNYWTTFKGNPPGLIVGMEGE